MSKKDLVILIITIVVAFVGFGGLMYLKHDVYKLVLFLGLSLIMRQISKQLKPKHLTQ